MPPDTHDAGSKPANGRPEFHRIYLRVLSILGALAAGAAVTGGISSLDDMLRELDAISVTLAFLSLPGVALVPAGIAWLVARYRRTRGR